MQLTKGAIGNLINRYKAVLKKCHLMNTFGSLAVAGMLIMGGAGVAVAVDDVELKGENSYNSTTTPNVNHLMGGWKVTGAEAAAPGHTGDITLTVTGGTISEIIGGSYAQNVNKDDVTVTHGNITTTISGDKTTSAEFVVGGSKVAGTKGAKLVTGKTSLTIGNGTFGVEGTTADYELVMGGNYAKTAGSNALTATTKGSSVAVNDGTFHASVVGGSVAHNYSSSGRINVTDNGATSVVINGGTFAPSQSSSNGGINLKAAVIGGGLAYGANTNSVLDAGSSVTIDGEKTVVNGKVVAGSVVAEGGYAAIVHRNTTLTMKNGTVSDDLVGGGMVQGAATLTPQTAGAKTGENPNAQKQPDANLIVTGDSSVTVAGGTAKGEIIGGNYVRGNGSARVDNSSVTITNGIFSTDIKDKAQYIIGGSKSIAYQDDTAKTTVKGNSSVLVDGNVTIVDGAVVGGSMAKAQDNGKATATVGGNSSVTVNEGTLAGVVGGGLAETYYGGNTTPTATSEVTGTSSVTINGGTINKVQFGAVTANTGTLGAAIVGGGLANDAGSTATVTNTNVSITGGTINGHVVAGGAADGTGAKAEVTNANLTIKGGNITGNVYAGGAALDEGTATVDNFKVLITGGTITGDVVAGNYTGEKAEGEGQQTAMFALLAPNQVSTAGKGGSITIGGDATIGGKVDASAEGVATNVVIDGAGAKVTGGYEGNKDSTLTFNNYNDEFSNVAYGFGTLSVAEGSSVRTGAVVSGKQGDGSNPNDPKTGFFGARPNAEGSSNPITITGGGTITAKQFHVSTNANVTIAHGNVVADDVQVQSATLKVGGESTSASLTVNEKLIIDTNHPGNQNIDVENLGTLTLGKNIVLDENGELKTKYLNTVPTHVKAGGTLKVNGLEDGKPLTSEELAALKGLLNSNIQGIPPGEGLLDLGGADLGDAMTPDADGNVSYDSVQGITSDSLKDATVVVSDAANGTGVSGGFQAVKLEGDNDLNAKGTLVLNGSAEGGNLVQDKDGKVASLRIGGQATSVVTLGDANAANKGRLDNVILNAGSNNEATLNVVGNGKAEFTIGNVTANNSQNTVNVAGATLNTGDITVDAVSNTYKDIDLNVTNGTVNSKNAEIANVTVTNGAVNARGDLTATNAKLANGALTAAVVPAAAEGQQATGGNITISDKLSGQGSVVAEKTLTLTKGYEGAADDALTLKAETLAAKAIDSTAGKLAIDSTAGKLAIAADTLNATGAVTLKDDTLTAKNAKLVSLTADGQSLVDLGNVALTGALTAKDQSVVVVQDFGAFDGTEGAFQPKALDKAVTVSDKSLMVFGSSAAQAQKAVAETGHTGAAYYAGKTLNFGATDGSLAVGIVDSASSQTVAFGKDSLLVVDGKAMKGKSVFTSVNDATASVDAGSKLHVDNATVSTDFTVFGDKFDKPTTGWDDKNLSTDSSMLDAAYDKVTSKVTVKANDAHTVFPDLSGNMANAVNKLYKDSLNNVDSDQMGVRFLSRATNDRFLGMDKKAAAESIESAARIAFAGAAPQMTKMASDAATNAVVNRLGFANPVDGLQAIDAEGKIVDRNTTGFALWIAPLWQSQNGWGLEADSMDYGFNGNLGGVSLGADYTFENALRAGITFNIGGGYAESSGGDLSSTENRMNFWGLGAYAGWNYENFGVMADVSYTSTWNQLKQDLDSRLGMGNELEADVRATAISAGLRAEYLLKTSALDIIPHIGVRYMSLNTWGYDVEANGGNVLEGDSLHQDIWTFPIGVTFSKEFATDSGWNFKPSLDFSVIPAAGDIKAKHDVRFTGLPGTYEVETQMMDYLTWQGGVGLELANDNMSIGVNYTLQAGEHTTGHGVFGSFRYEF